MIGGGTGTGVDQSLHTGRVCQLPSWGGGGQPDIGHAPNSQGSTLRAPTPFISVCALRGAAVLAKWRHVHALADSTTRGGLDAGRPGSVGGLSVYRLRLFAVRHARGFEWLYRRFETALVAFHPLLARVGYDRVERPVAWVESTAKGLIFDCRMCGQCVLSSTGMSCPMNCPKELRNGPCGGVRRGGFCEVRPEMRCVWMLAWDGAARMRGHDRILEVLPPVDRRLQGSSAWLRASREAAARRRCVADAGGGPEPDAGRSTLARAFSRARAIEPASAPLAGEPPRTSRDRRR